MTMFEADSHPHRRRNPLTGRWVLVSPHRNKRPWQGDASPPSIERGPSYDPGCYLCPGNLRSGGQRNPDYAAVFAFDNDFPALLGDTPEAPAGDPLYQTATARGMARVICYSPDHSKTLAELSPEALRQVVDLWASESAELFDRFASVLVFENKGAIMGCSSPHPHGQIWISDFVPDEVAAEDAAQGAWLAEHGSCLLAEVAEREIAAGERVVAVNKGWLAVVPWWAVWPFEVLLIARSPCGRIDELDDAARDDLAAILLEVTRRYDALFGVSMPYSMGWHQRPGGAARPEAWRLHAHFNPPLLRSATVRKFMVGFEMFGESQRDLTPETAAAMLRAAGDVR